MRKLTAPFFMISALVIAALAFAAYWIWIREPDLGPPGANPSVVAAPKASTDGLRLPKKVGSLRFAVIGDMGRGDQTQIDTANQMVRWHTFFPYDFVLMLGDNIYDQSGSPESFYNRFELPYKPLLDAGIKFYAAVGNHDP
ncbi:MAG: metallophosphoesterase, partial [Acidobacteria bacterium]|nr:metallophosphoesterase [Acidobacteriota bacterium]